MLLPSNCGGATAKLCFTTAGKPIAGNVPAADQGILVPRPDVTDESEGFD